MTKVSICQKPPAVTEVQRNDGHVCPQVPQALCLTLRLGRIHPIGVHFLKNHPLNYSRQTIPEGSHPVLPFPLGLGDFASLGYGSHIYPHVSNVATYPHGSNCCYVHGLGKNHLALQPSLLVLRNPYSSEISFQHLRVTSMDQGTTLLCTYV